VPWSLDGSGRFRLWEHSHPAAGLQTLTGLRPNRPALAGPILGPSPHPAACHEHGSGNEPPDRAETTALQHNGNCASCLSSMLRIPSRLPNRQMTVKPAQQRIMLPWRAFGTGFAGHAPAAGWITDSVPPCSGTSGRVRFAQTVPRASHRARLAVERGPVAPALRCKVGAPAGPVRAPWAQESSGSPLPELPFGPCAIPNPHRDGF